MSSLVLLNRDGVVARKIQLISLPNDFVVPEGMTISWKEVFQLSWGGNLFGSLRYKKPVEAFFYLGDAWGQICHTDKSEKPEEHGNHWLPCGYRTLTIIVQGTSAKNVMELRDHILRLVYSDARWEARNDLNKIGLLHRIKKLIGMAK